MRLWTIHPKYLDPRGLVALWREALLARRVLEGRTRGYRQHPQLVRFRSSADPLSAINAYLRTIFDEAERRGYSFDSRKLTRRRRTRRIAETNGQLAYEWRHLRARLRRRAPTHAASLAGITRPDPHPLFTVVPGRVRSWERRPSRTRAG